MSEKEKQMYSASNANLTSYGAGFRIWIVALVAKLAGIQVHIEGLPFGDDANLVSTSGTTTTTVFMNHGCIESASGEPPSGERQ